MYRCRNCGHTGHFKVTAREDHTWTVDANGEFIEDHGCDYSEAHPENYIACDECGSEDVDTHWTPISESEMLGKWFINARWCIADILAVRPSWSKARAYAWLEKHERSLKERITELGNEVLEDMLIGEE